VDRRPGRTLAAGVATASLVLIAPGTAVAGVPVGFMTAGAATDAINQRLGATTIVLGDGGPTVTAAQLGAAVDARGLAESAFDARPMWNVTQWFGDSLDAPVTLDANRADAALRAAAVRLHGFGPGAGVFHRHVLRRHAGRPGHGSRRRRDRRGPPRRVRRGNRHRDRLGLPVPVAAPASSEKAQSTADQLNAMLQTIGFYVGEERTVPVDPATAASWLTITPDASGTFSISADAAKIQASVDALPAAVNRAPANGTVITNSDGTVLETSVPAPTAARSATRARWRRSSPRS
jgi:hypothetical protein